MDSTRKISLTAGLLYLITFVSIPTLFLYNAVRGANYIVGSGPDTSVFVGGTLELIVALAGIGTAVALYPVVKRQNEGVALGFVGVRTLEAAMIFVGVFSLLSVVGLRRAGAGTGALATGQALIGMHDWTFVLGQSLFPAADVEDRHLGALRAVVDGQQIRLHDWSGKIVPAFITPWGSNACFRAVSSQ
jgi:hypothetical protein